MEGADEQSPCRQGAAQRQPGTTPGQSRSAPGGMNGVGGAVGGAARGITTFATRTIRAIRATISTSTSASTRTSRPGRTVDSPRRGLSGGPDARRQKGCRNRQQQGKRSPEAGVVEEAVPAWRVDDQVVVAHGRED